MYFAKSLPQNLTKVSQDNPTFTQYDYAIVFVIIFVFNMASGFYFAFFARKQTSANEYLLGGRKMKVLPIAISLVASYTSSETLIAVPADVYQYGAAYVLGALSNVLVAILTIFVYLPVFFRLKITSIYEYLERRFDYRTRLFASFLSILSYILYLPLIIYIPSLVFSTATGVNVQFMATITCGLCIFYTAIGGLKAVVWTDTFQFIIAISTFLTIYLLGLKSTGGFNDVWQKSIKGARLDIFDFDIDPTKRDSFWTVVIGLTIHRLGTSTVAQECVQKILAVPTFRSSALSFIYFATGTTIVKIIAIFLGLLMYARYIDCDPLTSNKISARDELVIYFVMDATKYIPGISGLFIAGIFSASLSALSASLNCLAGIIYEDFVLKSVKPINEQTATKILKFIVVISGIICTLLVSIVEHLGGVFSLGMSLSAITGGAILGMFTLGLLFPKANAKGAFYGGIWGLIVTSSIVFPAQLYQSRGFSAHDPKPLSIERCTYRNSSRIVGTTKNILSSLEVPYIFRISFYYYSSIGAIVTIVTGLVVSSITETKECTVDESLLSPLCHSSSKKTRKLLKI